MRTLLKRIAIIIAVVFCLTILFWLSLSLAFCIPASMLEENALQSQLLMEKEGDYPSEYASVKNGNHHDNYTTYYMLEIAVQPINNPLIESLEAKRFEVKSEMTEETQNSGFGHMIVGDSNSQYSRYWHGYVVLLRPLLVFFNVLQIRLIAQIVFFCLLAALISVITYCLIRQHKNACIVGVLLTLSFMCLGGAQATETLPLSFSFSLSCLGSICVLKVRTLRKEKGVLFSRNFKLFIFFLILGAMTLFFDFLDNPILTLCIPLSIFLICHDKFSSFKILMTTILVAIAGWFFGYFVLWVCKWIIVELFTGIHVFEDAFEHAALYSGFETLDRLPSTGALAAFEYNLRNTGIMQLPIMISGVAAIACTIYLIIKYKKNSNDNKKEELVKIIGLLCISLLPFLWYSIFSTHSIMHASVIAYRTLIGSIFPWLLIIYLTISNIWQRRKGVLA